MKKKTVLYTIISCLVTLIPMFAGLFIWDRLPEQMATSYGFDGEINGYNSKFFAVIGFPIILVIADLICIIATSQDPRRKNISDKALALVLSIIPVCSLFCGTLMYQDALGYSLPVGIFASVFLGIAFFAVGLLLPKCKQNYTVGIRLPWTLHSEENWNKTHLYGRKVWTVGGVVITIAGLLGFEVIVVTGIFVLALLPTVYSYIYYRKYEK